jgi:hypothetical protein
MEKNSVINKLNKLIRHKSEQNIRALIEEGLHEFAFQ